MLRISLYIVFGLLLVACNTSGGYSPNYAVPLGSNPEALAELVVFRKYREKQASNPEKPAIYIDGKIAGQLDSGDVLRIKVEPGSHTIMAKEPFVFIPITESGNVTIDFQAKQTYYIRYHNEKIGTTQQGSTLELADESAFREKH